MNILLKDVTLQVKNNMTKGQTFTTTLGIPQGDCHSAILFTLYLSNTFLSGATSTDVVPLMKTAGVVENSGHCTYSIGLKCFWNCLSLFNLVFLFYIYIYIYM